MVEPTHDAEPTSLERLKVRIERLQAEPEGLPP